MMLSRQAAVNPCNFVTRLNMLPLMQHVRLFSSPSDYAADAGTFGQLKKQFGQTKYNFNGIKYNRGLNYGHSIAQNTSKVFLPFTPTTVWDNPGARRQKKQVGRGNGSGKGKTAGRGHKGMYARAGGQINRGFEGGQSKLSTRLPKRGFRSRRFNNDEYYEKLNLGKIAEFIEKGHLKIDKPITLKVLFEVGMLSKIKYGVKILGGGANKFKDLGVPLTLEASDASESAIEAVSATGGEIVMKYRTSVHMRYYLKPHKLAEFKQGTLKEPMPPPKRVKKLEMLRAKGIKVEYPTAPWFTNNVEKHEKDAANRAHKLANAQHADLLPVFPADRSPGISADIPRVERKGLFKKYKYL